MHVRLIDTPRLPRYMMRRVLRRFQTYNVTYYLVSGFYSVFLADYFRSKHRNEPLIVALGQSRLSSKCLERGITKTKIQINRYWREKKRNRINRNASFVANVPVRVERKTCSKSQLDCVIKAS